ncbi:MAG: hypothetical protein F6K41_05125 [Symploca sp. SIO3E6]|nr:hypothetical protein [Caldora sp. SIO3E6]
MIYSSLLCYGVHFYPPKSPLERGTFVYRLYFVRAQSAVSEWNNLSLMNDEDIDYSIIPEALLQELALGNELYIATSALVELWMRENSAVARIAWEILSTSHGDLYLQATALSALFSTDKEKALHYMSEKVVDCEPLLLNEIMKLIIDSPSDFVPSSTSKIFQTTIERLTNLRNEQGFIEPDVQQELIQLYNASALSGIK